VTFGRTAAWALTAAVAALSPAAAPGASSFDRWLANPFPVADGFSPAAGDGGAVTAAATGKVVAARPVVVIEHIMLDGHDKRRVRSRYGRLSRVDVRVGQIVRRGAVIGAVGPGEALQFDIRSGGEQEPDAAAFVRAHARLPDPAAEKQLVLIDQQRFRMQVRVDGRVRRDVEIGLGQAAGQKRREGDLRTPKGIYFVVDKQKGKFDGPSAEYFGGYWIKINYPGATDAAWGLREGVIDAATAETIAAAWSERRLTPQTTPLGSGIGFHGWAEEWKAPRGGARLSFGCIVMHAPDIATWFEEVPTGTMVVIF
jgi:hypothetical protein